MLHYELETSALTKGWLGFKLHSAEDDEKIMGKHRSFGSIHVLLKKWTPLFDAKREFENEEMIWFRLLAFPMEY